MNWNTKRTLIAVRAHDSGVEQRDGGDRVRQQRRRRAGNAQRVRRRGDEAGLCSPRSIATRAVAPSTALGSSTSLTDGSQSWKVRSIQGWIHSAYGRNRRRPTKTYLRQHGNRHFNYARLDRRHADRRHRTYVIWMGGLFVDGGATSAGTTTLLTDSSQSFGPNSLIGGARHGVDVRHADNHREHRNDDHGVAGVRIGAGSVASLYGRAQRIRALRG
jgi:hypothetical protein